MESTCLNVASTLDVRVVPVISCIGYFNAPPNTYVTLEDLWMLSEVQTKIFNLRSDILSGK